MSPLRSAGGTPGVDETHTEVPEVTDVARGDRCSPRKCYPRYLSVPQLDRLARALTSSDNCTGRICGGDVEGEDPLVEILVEHPLKGSFEMPTTARRRKELQARSDLEHGDRRRPNRLRRLSVEPVDHDGLWLGSHECRQHVGVEQDHGSERSAPCAGWPRSSAKSCSTPSPRNRDAIVDPSRTGPAGPARTAARRISRTSSSVERPWARALRWSASFTFSSSWRTKICAMHE